MVQLEEVRDEEFERKQAGPLGEEEEDDWNTDSESELSDAISDDDGLDESLADRLAALKDIVPPAYRKQVAAASATGYDWAARALTFGGSALWVVGASVLLVGVPFGLSFADEQQVQEMEREMRMQQSATEMMTRGAESGQTEARPAV